MKPLILVDFSNAVWACYYASLPEKVLENLRLKLERLSVSFEVEIKNFLMVKDQRPEAKYLLYPEYKAGRKKPDQDPRPDAEAFVRKEWGSKFIWSPGNEADDAIAALTDRSIKAGREVIVVSNDKDLYQLLQSGCSIYDHVKRLWVLPEHIEKAFGVTDPGHIVLVKALWGDVGDNVPNVIPRQQKQLLPLIKATGDLNKVLAGEGTSPKCRDLLIRNQAEVLRNYELVRLNKDVKLEWG